MKTFTKCALFLFWLVPIGLLAQSTITGKVTDIVDGEPIPGVNIIIKGTANGTTTDFNGNYTITDVNQGDIIIFSYVGFITQEIPFDGNTPINVSMDEDAAELDQVVVVGYGTARKKDLTGSVQLLTSKDLNQGAITTADQLLNGRSPGVRIVTSGGEPDATSNIRIRGGSSLSANNSPLIVLDGVPISNNNPAGQANVLALVNPNDIESFSILKDASATAIYGSRASNGVIIITTKAGAKGQAKFEFNSNVQIGTLSNKLDVFTGTEYVDFVTTNFPDQTGLLGVNGVLYDTNWQEEIYRTSFTSDNNFTARANLFGKIPFRGSLGFTKNEGILRESEVDRYSAAMSARPFLFDDSLKLTINLKGIITEKNQPDQEAAIGAALSSNPTIPVLDPTGSDFFGGFFQRTDARGFTVGSLNPVSLLNQDKRSENADRFIGNFKADYSLPFLQDLRAILNLGLDYSESDIIQVLDANAIKAWNNNSNNLGFRGGEIFRERQIKRDQTLEAYLSYATDMNGFLTRVDAQAGYSYQDFNNSGTVRGSKSGFDDNGDRDFFTRRYFNPLNLQSFFGRVNLNLAEKYLVTASIRADASSLFSEDERWGYFPAAAIAWKLKEEFFENSKTISDLKLRAGYGITGQQDITGSSGYFPYVPLYTPGDSSVGYIFGNQAVLAYRADPFDPDITWEKTTTYNFGLDFDLYNGWFSGTLDYYKRNTDDLLAQVPQTEGNLSNIFIQNVGETESEGVEIALNLKPIDNQNLTIQFNVNAAFNETYITDLGSISSLAFTEGDIGRGTGVNISYYAQGERSRNFWLYEQVYDTEGNPIADAFVDQNGDNVINDLDRIYIPYEPKWTYGFGTNINFKRFDLAANLRGQLGGKIYNANELNRGYAENIIPITGAGVSINNILNLSDADGVYQGFFRQPTDNQALSDYYISDASFLRFDNITLGYDLGDLLVKSTRLRIYGSINNVAIITDYDGLDPENFNGIEKSPYARPRTYTFGVNMNF